jgi:hypothetical protein
MKAKVCFWVLGVLLILALTNPPAQASTYLGQYTWTITITESSSELPPFAITLTGGISKVGGSYYLFQGYIIVPDDFPVMLSGSGVLLEDTLYLTLGDSQNHTDNSSDDTGILRVTINKSTLNGDFYEVSTDLDTSDKQIQHGYSIGTLQCTGGTLPLP